MARRLPVGAAKLAVLSPEEMRQAIASAGPSDGYVLNSIQMPTAYPFLATDKPSIFVAHNVEHQSAAENAVNARSALMRFLYAREARLLEAAEERLCHEARLVLTLSAMDAQKLCPRQEERCIPLALSIGRQSRADDRQRAYDIGLIGNWSWAPNRIGLDWFIENVAPLLPPDLRVGIAGRFDRRPPAAPACVSYLGRVPDAQSFVLSCRVMALATKGGTGVQLKTIETFEEGMPAVATRAALRGVDFLPANVVVAEDPEAFASALVEQVESERAGRLARADGREFADRQRLALSAGLGRGISLFREALSADARGGAGRMAEWSPAVNRMRG
ncbi:glycosyltransferase family 4 protein [Consotaella salsifontis]|nr:glycosyltransferase family 4 protein [Consotaella salsifontis]